MNLPRLMLGLAGVVRPILAALALALIGGVSAHAYGPGVHVREVDRYAQLHPEWAAPDLRPFLRLGAMFPDIRGAGIPLPLNSHDKALGDAIAAVAEASGEDWQRAFALGYRLHTASDCAAQVHYLPWLTAATDLQVVNLFGAEDVAHEGDNELLVEGFGDLKTGDLSAVVEVLWHFVHEHPDALERVVDLFVAGLARRTDGAADEVAIRDGLAAFWARLRETLPADAEAQFLSLVAAARDWDLEAVLALLQVGPLAELLGGLPAAPDSVAVDPDELARLEAHLVGQDAMAFFSGYDAHFLDLGARILDDPGYRPWPWYHGKAIVAAVVAGLGRTVPGLARRPEVLVYDAAFRERDGAVLASAELFLAFGEPVTVRMEVVADPPGLRARPTDDDVLGADTAVVHAGPERARLEVRFTPRTAGTEAHHLRFFAGEDADPFLTSDWDLVAAWADAPLFRAPYQDGYADFPPSHGRSEVDVDWGWMRGHAIAGARGVPADILVDGRLAGTAGPGGAYLVEPLAPGAHAFSARARGWGALPSTHTVVRGRLTIVDLPLVPTPIVRDGPAWSAHADALSVAWSAEGLPADSIYEVALGDDLEPETFASWRPAGTDVTEAVVALAAPAADGATLYGWVRVAGGPPARGSATRIDASPPIVRVVHVSCTPTVAVEIDAEDTLAPISAIEARLDGEGWIARPTGGAFTWARSGGPHLLEVLARNEAALETTISETICASTEADPTDTDTTDTTDTGPTEPGNAANAPPSPTRDESGCASGAAGSAWLALVYALALARRGARKAGGF